MTEWRVRRCWGAGISGWIAAALESRSRGEAADVVERNSVKVVLKAVQASWQRWRK